MRQIEAFWSPLNGSRHDRIRKLRYPKPVISSRSGELARHALFGERARDVGKLAFRKSRERDAAGRVPEHDRRSHGSERSLGATRRRASSTEGATLVASAYRHVARVEQTMNVTPQEQSVPSLMRATIAIW